jgi:hypothetical protein
MKEVIMDLGKENRGGLDQNDPFQLTANKDIMTRCKHLCVVCALRKHDFEERAPEPEADSCEAVPLAKAWIDGLPYRSVYHVASRGIGCTDCGERVMMTYDPEHMHERRVALCKT